MQQPSALKTVPVFVNFNVFRPWKPIESRETSKNFEKKKCYFCKQGESFLLNCTHHLVFTKKKEVTCVNGLIVFNIVDAGGIADEFVNSYGGVLRKVLSYDVRMKSYWRGWKLKTWIVILKNTEFNSFSCLELISTRHVIY